MRNLRSHIGIVLQDNLLFSDTIGANILYGNPKATEEEVIAAAKAAQIHDFIIELPDGYDTVVGERGVKLSGGQRQRSDCTSVLKNPSLLILDEATSALDLENERYIQEALQRLAADRTTIIIAHRLATITHVDTIIYIEDGEIKETGSHEELMKKRILLQLISTSTYNRNSSFSVKGAVPSMHNNSVVKVHYRLGSRNC